jgi:hypothetical protein
MTQIPDINYPILPKKPRMNDFIGRWPKRRKK